MYIETSDVDQTTNERLRQLLERSRTKYWKQKRVFDVIVSATALILLLPVFVAVSIAICLDDPHGSPIYKQTRIGRHGKPFLLYKFRTMVVNAEALRGELLQRNEMDGPVFKIKKDPRITRVGRILRQASLDELPQLFNVLKGDMSMVGPQKWVEMDLDYIQHRTMLLDIKLILKTPGVMLHRGGQ